MESRMREQKPLRDLNRGDLYLYPRSNNSSDIYQPLIIISNTTEDDYTANYIKLPKRVVKYFVYDTDSSRYLEMTTSNRAIYGLGFFEGNIYDTDEMPLSFTNKVKYASLIIAFEEHMVNRNSSRVSTI